MTGSTLLMGSSNSRARSSPLFEGLEASGSKRIEARGPKRMLEASKVAASFQASRMKVGPTPQTISKGCLFVDPVFHDEQSMRRKRLSARELGRKRPTCTLLLAFFQEKKHGSFVGPELTHSDIV